MGNCLTLQYYSTFPQMCQLKAMIIQGPGGYFQDPGFDQNTVWDSGKLKIP